MTKVQKATHEGELHIGNLILPCAVLEDGTRVLSESGVGHVLGRKKGGRRAPNAPKLPRYISGTALMPHISEELMVHVLNPTKYRTIKGKIANGVPATLLPKICEVWMDAQKDGKLTALQNQIADKAEVLLRGFAHVGVVALVDEATGYQEVRARDELNKILSAYISEELMKWARRFPEEFYKQIFRLHNWPYDPASVKRPSVVGKMTNELIYEQLPPGVLKELREKNPKDQRGKRKYKHFQFLTEDIGNPHLERQIASVTTLMRASPNKNVFMRMFKRAFPRAGQQDELPLNIDEETQ